MNTFIKKITRKLDTVTTKSQQYTKRVNNAYCNSRQLNRAERQAEKNAARIAKMVTLRDQLAERVGNGEITKRDLNKVDTMIRKATEANEKLVSAVNAWY